MGKCGVLIAISLDIIKCMVKETKIIVIVTTFGYKIITYDLFKLINT